MEKEESGGGGGGGGGGEFTPLLDDLVDAIQMRKKKKK